MLRFPRYVLFLLLTASLLAQSKPSKRTYSATSLSAYKLIAIKVSGTERYTPEEVIAASGLRIGENVTEENFKEASQKLGETGAFTEITYSYSYSAAGTKLELQLSDNDQLVPVLFDNFVWFSDQELIHSLRAYVPLFKDQLPVAGPLPDRLADALNTMLSQKGVAGHAQYVRSSASGDGPIQSFVYSVDGVEVSIRNVEFPGASAAHLPSLQAVARKEIEQGEYGRSRLAIVARTALRPVYLKQGYLKARFGEAQAVLVGSSPQETMVDAKLPVEEGRQYKLEKIAWTSNTIFPAQELQSLIHLPVGQPANTLQLEQDFAGVRRLYGSRGYVKAVLEPRPFFKDDEGTVAYVIEVKEGDIYRMGDVDIEGLDDKATARLREDWKLREGDPYDSSYAKKFLDQSAPDLPPRTKWKITVHESVNDKDRTVDVTLRFAPAKEGLP